MWGLSDSTRQPGITQFVKDRGAVIIYLELDPGLETAGQEYSRDRRMLDVSRNTVRRYLRGEELPRSQREARPNKYRLKDKRKAGLLAPAGKAVKH